MTEECDFCQGSGIVFCETCSGAGNFRGIPCQDCEGLGKETCLECGGSGEVESEEEQDD